SADSSRHVPLVYRTASHEPGMLALLAANSVSINATLSDGFFTDYTAGSAAPSAQSLYDNLTGSANYQSYLGMFSGGVLQYNSSGAAALIQFQNKTWKTANGVSGAPAATGVPSAAFFGFTSAAQIQQYNNLLALGGADWQTFHLVKPVTITSTNASVVDQYNQYYAEYVAMFQAYMTDLLLINTTGAIKANLTGNNQVSGGAVLSYADFIRDPSI